MPGMVSKHPVPEVRMALIQYTGVHVILIVKQLNKKVSQIKHSRGTSKTLCLGYVFNSIYYVYHFFTDSACNVRQKQDC